ncbi:MAG: EpsD family peptidyl-prolyl cis-trans isomerase, partial [Rugosibacter sp.]
MINRVCPLGLLLVFATLQGCGSGTGTGKAPASQVAARVNGGEITIYRVNSVLGELNNPDPRTLVQTRRGVLDSLIDQELAAQAAEDAKLDRMPTVMQASEAVRREVLARAWLEQISATLPKPDATQISRYYADHPELFARRRVYTLQQIVLTAQSPALLSEVRQRIGAGTSMQQIGHWLEERQVNYSAGGGLRAAEQIPLDILVRLSNASDGETLLIKQPSSVLVVHLVSSSLQPMAEADAAPRIRKFLANQAWTEALTAEIKRLKRTASITYLGE